MPEMEKRKDQGDEKGEKRQNGDTEIYKMDINQSIVPDVLYTHANIKLTQLLSTLEHISFHYCPHSTQRGPAMIT